MDPAGPTPTIFLSLDRDLSTLSQDRINELLAAWQANRRLSPRERLLAIPNLEALWEAAMWIVAADYAIMGMLVISVALLFLLGAGVL